MTAVRCFADLVAVGRIIKPQGRRGEVAVAPLTDRPDRLPGLRQAFLPGADGQARSVSVAACRPHNGRFVLKLDGYDSIDAAEQLRGLELRIGEEELAPLPAGSYYHHQLLGLEVVDGLGRHLGHAARILQTGAAADVLVVDGGREEILLPLAERFVPRVDLAAGRIQVELPESVTIDARH